LGIRLRQYVVGINISLEHPIFGIGGANYPYVADRYGLPSTLGNVPFPLHNIYIALLAETGFIGAFFYAIALGLVIVSGWRLYTNEYTSTPLAIGLLSSIVGYLAVAFWVVNVRFVMILPFWLLMGALLGEYALTADDPSSDTIYNNPSCDTVQSG
jgi:O-antigen ligase